MLLLRYRKVVLDMTMGERIKALREEKKMSQEELGKLCGVNRAAVNKWETGQVENIKRSTIQKLSEIFNKTPCFIMCFDEDNKASTEQLQAFDQQYNQNNELAEEVKVIEGIEKFFGSSAVEIIELFNELNELGKTKAIENLTDLAELTKYRNSTT